MNATDGCTNFTCAGLEEENKTPDFTCAELEACLVTVFLCSNLSFAYKFVIIVNICVRVLKDLS